MLWHNHLQNTCFLFLIITHMGVVVNQFHWIVRRFSPFGAEKWTKIPGGQSLRGFGHFGENHFTLMVMSNSPSSPQSPQGFVFTHGENCARFLAAPLPTKPKGGFVGAPLCQGRLAGRITSP